MASMRRTSRLLALLVALQLSLQLAHAVGCPHLLNKRRAMLAAEANKAVEGEADGKKNSTLEEPAWLKEDNVVRRRRHARARQMLEYPAYDVYALKADIQTLLVTPNPNWAMDPWGTYGPLMVRMAWHCSGSYRAWDGRGGCDGARIRFSPESEWADNTNIDKARMILQPLKDKYPGISWGDLIVLTGTTAIEIAGGPSLGFCGGRVDDVDGTDSLPLGPSAYQQAVAPCDVNGQCDEPLGPTTIGLIYVNPEGPMGNPDPIASAAEVRAVFKHMDMDDAETVALIGGGHVLGKMHGACTLGPGLCTGLGPIQGQGPNTYTSGFEGPWGFAPHVWTNEFFMHLRSHLWEVFMGPGGHYQWKPTPETASNMPPQFAPFGILEHFMLTSDMALLYDMAYNPWVQLYASNLSSLQTAFASAWYKLVNRDMGPVSRCVGSLVAPAVPSQNPLPATPALLADFGAVKATIKAMLKTYNGALNPDMAGSGLNVPYYGAQFMALAWRCASTYRDTDHQGGCNGARIRLSPQKDWPINAGLDAVLNLLAPVKAQYDQSIYGGPALSWADLIVLAGQAAVEDASGRTLKFCGGRTDAADGQGGPAWLAPRSYRTPVIAFRDNADVLGVTLGEAVALAAIPRSALRMLYLQYTSVPAASWAPGVGADPSKLTNAYFKTLVGNQWDPVTVVTPNYYYSRSGGLAMTTDDIAIVQDTELLKWAQAYANDNSLFLSTFATAWQYVMNADRFAGPTTNLCS